VLFRSDNAGRTYTLILTPADIPAETVMLKPRGQNRPDAAQWERSQPYPQTLKRLLVQMARDSIPEGYEVVERGVLVPLWQEALFRLDREYRGDAFTAEVYTLTNRSGMEMVMEEREFFRPGVVAVAIEKSVLAPAAVTRVYVIHKEARRD
jgi:conjugal transfer pilus assembly protein TraK